MRELDLNDMKPTSVTMATVNCEKKGPTFRFS